jgi:hypothetical protein
MENRPRKTTDADVRAWLRGNPPNGGAGNAAPPAVHRVAEFVLDLPMEALEPVLAYVPRGAPAADASDQAALEAAHRAVAVALGRFRLGLPERPGWPGFGRGGTEQRALVSWAEVTATRAPGFAKQLLDVIVAPVQPAALRRARVVVLAATGRVEEARREAMALAHDWLAGAARRELAAADVEQLLARLPPDDDLAALRRRVVQASPSRTGKTRGCA